MAVINKDEIGTLEEDNRIYVRSQIDGKLLRIYGVNGDLEWDFNQDFSRYSYDKKEWACKLIGSCKKCGVETIILHETDTETKEAEIPCPICKELISLIEQKEEKQ